MNSFLKKILKKARAAAAIMRAQSIRSTITIGPEIEARNVIDSILRARLRPNNIEQELSIKSCAEQILAAIRVPPEQPLPERAESLLDGALSQAFWYHGQLAGVTTTWEFRVRILANKLGIRPNIPIEEKSKKNRSNKSVEHRKLKDTIKELHKACNNHLDLKLLELCDLRDSIIHCNPHGVRTYATQIFGKDVLKPLRGNVVVIAQNGKDARNLSNVKEEQEAEDQDIIGWFLEVYNSGLPKKAMSAFGESIKAIDQLITLHASSFDTRAEVFNNIVINGRRPTEQEIADFRAYFTAPYNPVKRDADLFFKDILELLKGLK